MIVLGTSGWQYRDWRDRFYPADVPQRQWLEFFAGQFATVEVNNAFYRLPERETFGNWGSRVPTDFCFAVKMSRYLTHIKRLADPAEPIERFVGRAQALGVRLGPVLLQLPPTLRADAALLDGVLRRFPPDLRIAVEPRHPSWWVPDIRATLEKHQAALAWADRRGRPVTPLWQTADWGYLRLHEGGAKPSPHYGRAALHSWLERIAATFSPLDGHDVYVYFNNDYGGAAIDDACAFGRMTTRADYPVSRYPHRPAR
jgi:uncharacterized protein YecE (DUF72 family)